MTRTRKTSAHEMTDILKRATNKILPPEHVTLRERDKPFWDDITAARDEWTKVDLCLAANMARSQADIEDLQFELDHEGPVVINRRGTPIMNPKFSAIEALTRRVLNIAAKIHVHAAATQGEVKQARSRSAAKRSAAGMMDNLDDEDDDLIARPLYVQ